MKARDALDRIAAAIVEDIFAATDDEIAAEIIEDGGDPSAAADRARAAYAAALAKTERPES